ncbi:MerR family transcriptional regulator [Streptomyces caniscabiei]|uniref:MerR family transcriptional regulator n=1 Tax=Streptomyces caniscabiei TaxID=2746961 RepID=UPI001CE1552A|nr:MerR family transcriptional regulator [Streptomyces caniscabiei]MDX3512766.1 MerR family transcriptional regulator [Streptomyces caniscabiei]MDX3722291.1 MerR family transcriptional regulator [Streptomyces caniscabiei]MDX3733393.1 MerR family transcriptional regulator [Streptomyces caniscabiei]WEO28732.1 MerR family transcriptional regulator [Streptomyces caniscabiei]
MPRTLTHHTGVKVKSVTWGGVSVLIGELSRRTGVAARLLRYYDEQGLLCPDRDSSGYRVYAPDAPFVVARIRGMLAAGLTTDAIREMLPCATDAGPGIDPCPEVLRTMATHLERMDADIADLRRRRAALAAFRDATDARQEQRRAH